MTKFEFVRYVNRFRELLQLLAPKDTGNLAFNSIKLEWRNNKEAVIYIDGDGVDGVAPYAPFTNEPWVAERWNDKKNPNEGWWDNAIPQIINQLNKEFGGRNAKSNNDKGQPGN